jgi:NAD(P)-dependent dehydrogenase (short-subunit alcohol dehydrogenase family)
MNAPHRDLRGKVALVTGASRGVGAAIAVALAAEGCAVACAARATDESPLRLPGTIDATVDRIRSSGGDALSVPTNLANEDEVVSMVARTVAHYGRLDLLVNNAAITFVGDLEMPMKRFDLVFAVNLRAPFVAIREAAPHLRSAGGGSIVNVSSLAALFPPPGMAAYGMSKLALEHLTLDAARELRPDGTAVNCFRIDIAVASEGFVANTPGADHASWEPCEVPAEGIVWMLKQPMPYTGRRESMYELRARESIMASRAPESQVKRKPVTELANGIDEMDAEPTISVVDG